MKRFNLPIFAIGAGILMTATFSSCSKDAETTTYNYAFNTGQVGSGTAYAGSHGSVSATVKLTEDGDQTIVTVTLMGTQNGQDYNVHVHDAADPTTTPNGTPYNETPNSAILVTTIAGNGGTVSKDYTSTMSFEALTTTYGGGFFVVHDPTQAMSTTDLTTYLIVGAFPG